MNHHTRKRITKTLVAGLGVVGIGAATVGLAGADPGPTVEQLAARGCSPHFTVQAPGLDPVDNPVTNNQGCAGIKVWVAHDGPDGRPVVEGVHDLGGGTIHVDPRAAACGRRTHREGNRVVPGGDTVQWDATTADPTQWSGDDHNYRIWTAAWNVAPPCPAPAPAPTTPPPAPTAPPAPAPTAPPTTAPAPVIPVPPFPFVPPKNIPCSPFVPLPRDLFGCVTGPGSTWTPPAGWYVCSAYLDHLVWCPPGSVPYTQN